MHKVGLWVHICTIRAYRVCRDQHHLDICSLRVDRGVFSLVGVVVERRGVVFFLVGATREGWVNVCWGAGGWVLLFLTSRSFEYTSTKWLWVSSDATAPPRSPHSPRDTLTFLRVLRFRGSKCTPGRITIRRCGRSTSTSVPYDTSTNVSVSRVHGYHHTARTTSIALTVTQESVYFLTNSGCHISVLMVDTLRR